MLKMNESKGPKMGGAIENVVSSAKKNSGGSFGSNSSDRDVKMPSGDPYKEMINRNNAGSLPKLD